MNLLSKSLSVGIWSENYEKLADWHKNVLGSPTHCCTFEDPEGNILQMYGEK